MKKGRIYSPVQDASFGRRGWTNKSKLAVEEGAVPGLTVEDNFNEVDGSHNDIVVMFLAALAFTVMATKNITHNKDFQPKMGLREEGKKRRKRGEVRRMWKGWYVNQNDFFL